jgi:UDPglucose--hexose-1-phosphate uridylyltransferase
MSELRNDLVTGRSVLLAPGRSARPHTVAPAEPDPEAVAKCPFCPGHEHETPPEVARRGRGAPDTPGWRIRVVPNLYPIVGHIAGGEHPGPGGAGAHEVAILHPDHWVGLGQLADTEVIELFRALRERARVLAARDLAHVQVLVNQGRAAGASIAHPHAQLLAIDFVPPAVVETVHRFEAARTDVVLTDAQASTAQGGHVATNADGPHGALVWCPWAGASPYELRITAADAGPNFETAPDPALDAVALATRRAVGALESLLGAAPYNVVVHNGPTRGDHPFHWYVTVVPRIATIAGFELGTGVFVNTVDPADAAAQLREVWSAP